MIHVLFGQQASKIVQSRWQIIKQVGFFLSNHLNINLQGSSAWRPLKGPLNDWPLGLCDARTVDVKSDTMPGDIVFREFATENLQVHYSPSHTWYWLPRQTVDEVLIFKSAESDATCTQGMSLNGGMIFLSKLTV